MKKREIEINGEKIETTMSAVDVMLTTEIIELNDEYNELLSRINKAKEIYLKGIESSWPNPLAEKMFNALENINVKIKEKK